MTPATAESFTAPDCANLARINDARQMETTAGALKFPRLEDVPPVLLGREANELSDMDGGVIDSSKTATHNTWVYGSFANGCVIAQRLGATTEIIPESLWQPSASDRAAGRVVVGEDRGGSRCASSASLAVDSHGGLAKGAQERAQPHFHTGNHETPEYPGRSRSRSCTHEHPWGSVANRNRGCQPRPMVRST